MAQCNFSIGSTNANIIEIRRPVPRLRWRLSLQTALQNATILRLFSILISASYLNDEFPPFYDLGEAVSDLTVAFGFTHQLQYFEFTVR